MQSLFHLIQVIIMYSCYYYYYYYCCCCYYCTHLYFKNRKIIKCDSKEKRGRVKNTQLNYQDKRGGNKRED